MNALTIGFFDGVHTGHQHLLRQLCGEAQRRALRSVALTFDVHPLSIVRPDFEPRLLTTFEEKVVLLRASGVDEVVVLPFTPELARLTVADFLQLLRTRHRASFLLMGHDHRFGSNGGAPFADYLAWGKAAGIEIAQADALRTAEGEAVSSSLIRRRLQGGNIALTNALLGRPYSLAGIVEKGRQIGRTIGFPTANLRLSPSLLRPDLGVYACWAETAGKRYPAVVNIGQRPTLGNGLDITTEAHLLHFASSLYGSTLRLSFLSRLRSEMKFDSLDALKAQIAKDREAALRLCAAASDA